MDLTTLQNLFGTQDGFFYRVVKNKTTLEILTDLNTTIHTIGTTQGYYIRTNEEITHGDYIRIVE